MLSNDIESRVSMLQPGLCYDPEQPTPPLIRGSFKQQCHFGYSEQRGVHLSRRAARRSPCLEQIPQICPVPPDLSRQVINIGVISAIRTLIL